MAAKNAPRAEKKQASGGCCRNFCSVLVAVIAVAVSWRLYVKSQWLTAEEVSKGLDLHGKVMIVTGATAGIGTETARVLALRGATVVIGCRNLQKCEATARDISASTGNKEVTALQLELSQLSSVKRFADAFLAMGKPLHVLINNAGISPTLEPYRTDENGWEITMSTNHIGHFYLTELLLPKLIATGTKDARARVVNVASEAHRRTAYDSATLVHNPEAPWYVKYGHSKLANVLHANELERRFRAADQHVSAYSLHPGSLIYTSIASNVEGGWGDVAMAAISPFTPTVPQGAATTVMCATSPALETKGGRYFSMCKEIDAAPPAQSLENAADLWKVSKKLLASWQNKQKA